MGVCVETVKASRWTKGRALLAGGLVLGVGAATTLAAWTDNEWVFGGSGNGDGTGPNTPGTGVYRMQQNTWAGTSGAEKWTDEKDPNGGALTFTVDPGKLIPGKTVYSPMQLRAVAGSEALDVALDKGIQSELNQGTKNSPALYAALTYGVYKGVDKASCEAGTVGAGSVVVPAGSPLTAVSATTFPLAAGANANTAGAPENLCFALTLPSSASADLQGLNTVPVWRFTSSVGQ